MAPPTKPKNSDWNYAPDLPISVSPILSWPPRPLAWIKWISSYWLAISSVTVELALAYTIYTWFQPSWEAMQSLSPGWIAHIWLRNVILICLIAGGLHLWFITFTRQGKAKKFDPRDQVKNNGSFTFRNQVHDNMFWSIAAGSRPGRFTRCCGSGQQPTVMPQRLHSLAIQCGLLRGS